MPAPRYQPISFIQAGLDMSFVVMPFAYFILVLFRSSRVVYVFSVLRFYRLSVAISIQPIVRCQRANTGSAKHLRFHTLDTSRGSIYDSTSLKTGYLYIIRQRQRAIEEAPVRPGVAHVVRSLPHSCSFAATLAAQSETSRLPTASCDSGDSTMTAEGSTHVY